MSRKTAVGVLRIATATATPFAAWASGEATLRSCVVLAIIAGLSTASAWISESPRGAK